MKRIMPVVLAGLTLSACGLGETAVSTAAGGAAEVEQAKAALKTEARVKEQLNAAQAVELRNRQDAEAGSQ